MVFHRILIKEKLLNEINLMFYENIKPEKREKFVICGVSSESTQT